MNARAAIDRTVFQENRLNFGREPSIFSLVMAFFRISRPVATVPLLASTGDFLPAIGGLVPAPWKGIRAVFPKEEHHELDITYEHSQGACRFFSFPSVSLLS
jgi:hypothetical protein